MCLRSTVVYALLAPWVPGLKNFGLDQTLHMMAMCRHRNESCNRSENERIEKSSQGEPSVQRLDPKTIPSHLACSMCCSIDGDNSMIFPKPSTSLYLGENIRFPFDVHVLFHLCIRYDCTPKPYMNAETSQFASCFFSIS